METKIQTIIQNAPMWFAFGAIAFLGAFAAYKIVTSKIVQTTALLLMSMLTGFILCIVLFSWLGNLFAK